MKESIPIFCVNIIFKDSIFKYLKVGMKEFIHNKIVVENILYQQK